MDAIDLGELRLAIQQFQKSRDAIITYVAAVEIIGVERRPAFVSDNGFQRTERVRDGSAQPQIETAADAGRVRAAAGLRRAGEQAAFPFGESFIEMTCDVRADPIRIICRKRNRLDCAAIGKSVRGEE